MPQAVEQRLAAGEILIIDGGMGSEIEAQGVEMDDTAWCALANVEHPDVVQRIHEQYLRAGADVIITNTFAAGRSVLESAEHGDAFEEINRSAVQAAQRARDAVGKAATIAGAVGGLPTASDMHFRDRGLSQSQLFDLFSAQVGLLVDSGVDVIALEMLGPGGYAAPAVRAATSSGLPVWAGLSVLRLIHGDETDYGTLANEADREEFIRLIDDVTIPGVGAVTVMHSHVDEVAPALRVLSERWSGTIGVYPHVGTFTAPHWHFEDISPESYLSHARTWLDAGVQLVGGCCGIRPDHIAALKSGLPDHAASVTPA
jgi:S-methylmethionine-dependent homocysteine/selenocysteine methylase